MTRMIDPLPTGELTRQFRARSLPSKMKTLAPLTHEDRSQHFDYRVKGGGVALLSSWALMISPKKPPWPAPLKPRTFQEERPVAWHCPHLASTELLMASEPRD